MPIRINDCRICGHNPIILTTAKDHKIKVEICCINGHFNEVEAESVIVAIIHWNDDNPTEITNAH